MTTTGVKSYNTQNKQNTNRRKTKTNELKDQKLRKELYEHNPKYQKGKRAGK